MSERSLFRSARIDQHRLSHPNVTCYLWKSSILLQWLECETRNIPKQSGSLTSFHPRKKILPSPPKKKWEPFPTIICFKEANYWPSARFFVFPGRLCHASSSWRGWKKSTLLQRPMSFLGHPKQRYQKCMIFFCSKVDKTYLYIEYIPKRKGENHQFSGFTKMFKKNERNTKKRKVNSFVLLDQSSNHPLSGVFHFWGGHLIWVYLGWRLVLAHKLHVTGWGEKWIPNHTQPVYIAITFHGKRSHLPFFRHGTFGLMIFRTSPAGMGIMRSAPERPSFPPGLAATVPGRKWGEMLDFLCSFWYQNHSQSLKVTKHHKSILKHYETKTQHMEYESQMCVWCIIIYRLWSYVRGKNGYVEILIA